MLQSEEPEARGGQAVVGPTMTDDELVSGMLAGDEQAFEQFADVFIPALYRFALYRLDRDRELTRDIVQTTVCKVFAKLDSFRGDAAFMTWLCACCRMEIAGHFRKKMRPYREVELSTAEHEIPRGPMSPPGPDKALLQSESAHLVHAVLDQLPPRYARVLEWKYLESLSVREIAGRMGAGEKATESLLTRARAAFRKGYSRLVDGSPRSARRALGR